MAPNIVFRVDSSPRIGSGHAVRSLALARACRARGWSVSFVMKEWLPGFPETLERSGVALIVCNEGDEAADARALSRIAHDSNAAWMVLDGYRFAASFRKEIDRGGARLLVIDDLGDLGPYESCDAVHNQNVAEASLIYGDRDAAVRWLLGPRYALLRPEFVAGRRPPLKVAPRGQRILVSLGGSDPKGLTVPVLRALESADAALDICVAIGGGFKRVEAIRRAARSSRHSVRFLEGVDDLSGPMADCDLAVIAAGTTLWEAAYSGTPTLALVVVDNQAPGAATFAAAGAGIVLDARSGLNGAMLREAAARLLPDAAARLRLARSGRRLVDGRGAARTAEALAEELR